MNSYGLGYLFDEVLEQHGSATALLQDSESMTYQELNRRCDRVAAGFLDLGVKAGDRVGLMFNNDIHFVECLFGSMRLGAVPVPLNVNSGTESMTFVLQDCRARVLIASRAMSTAATRIAQTLGDLMHTIITSSGAPDAIEYESWLQSQSPSFARRTIGLDSICMQPYTSGSTGRPKGVLLTHAGQLWSARATRESLGVHQSDRALISVPLFHKNALICALKPFLSAGGSVVVLENFDPVKVIESIERFKVTYITGVPAMYKRMLAESRLTKTHDVSSLRFGVCSSAEVRTELLQAFRREFGIGLIELYGLTEGGPLPLINMREAVGKPGSCGKPIAGGEAKIVAPNGDMDAPIGEVGELIVRNPGVARGYWERPDATAAKFREGWLRTGDLFRQDDDGYFFFVGRADDMINVGGEKVYPKEVEGILSRHAGIRDVCVVAMKHAEKGEVPVAFVVRDEVADVSESDLKSYYFEVGAAYAHPRKVFFLDRIPLNGTGKVDRHLLRTLANS